MSKVTKSSSSFIHSSLAHLTSLGPRPSKIKRPGCKHVLGAANSCPCDMMTAIDPDAVRIGSSSGPSPDEWARNHRQTRSLTLSSVASTDLKTFDYDITVVTTLHELHVKRPVYLHLKLDTKSSHHWLNDMAVRNESLEKLTLYGLDTPVLASAHIVPFKISNYFNRAEQDLHFLRIKSLTLRCFSLSDIELHNILTFCPHLTRLDLEHVTFVDTSTWVLPYNSLREIVLLQTTPTPRLIQFLHGAQTLVLKGNVYPPVWNLYGTCWTVSRNDFEELMMGMPQLKTVMIERVDFYEQDRRTPGDVVHPKVRRVFKNADMNIKGYFPRALLKPFWHY